MKNLILFLVLMVSPAFAAFDANGQFDNSDVSWCVTHLPAAATQATIPKTAVSGKRHVADCVHATIATDATAQTPLIVELLDNATALASWTVSAPANGQAGVALCNLKGLVGTANTTMTLRFSGAGVALSREAVTLCGHTIRSTAN
jgi:hypothetical protein